MQTAVTDETQTSQLWREIHEQPAALTRLLSGGWDAIEAAAQHIRAFDPSWVVIAARGTSDNAARYAKYVFGAENGLGVALASPSLLSLYDRCPDLSRALTIGISQSGQSPDIVGVLREARRQGGVTLAITNDTASPLAELAEHVVDLMAEEERAVAATKTYTTELLAVAMLSVALAQDTSRRETLTTIPARVREALELASPAEEAARACRQVDRFVVAGRGFNYSTAFELALKIKETSYVHAEAFSPADLLHGPIAMVGDGFPVLLIAPSGRAADNVAELYEPLAACGARTITLSDRADLTERADLALPLPGDVPEWLSPLVAIVPGQLFAHALAQAKGFDPDRPRGLNKVTRTH